MSLDLSDLELAVVDGPDLERVTDSAMHFAWPWISPYPPTPLWFDALMTASRIWKVIHAALVSGAELRRFEYGQPPSGGHCWLKPVNSAEVLRVPQAKSPLSWLNLTRVNREALVFAGLPTDNPPILFSSDSELNDCLAVVPSCALLITAPHHGSNDNAKAYANINSHAGTGHLWVRSDSANKVRPCEDFTTIPYEKRACTTCHRCSRLPSQAVVAGVVNGEWSLKSLCCPK